MTQHLVVRDREMMVPVSYVRNRGFNRGKAMTREEIEKLIEQAVKTSEALTVGAGKSDAYDAEMLMGDANLFDELSHALRFLLKEVKRKDEALKPFDKALTFFSSRMGEMEEIDEKSHMVGCRITVSNLRTARQALGSLEDE